MGDLAYSMAKTELSMYAVAVKIKNKCTHKINKREQVKNENNEKMRQGLSCL